MRDRLYRRVAGGVWYADYTDGSGKRRRKSTGTTDEDLANEVLISIVAESLRETHNIIAKGTVEFKQAQSIPIATIIEAWHDQKIDEGVSPTWMNDCKRYVVECLKDCKAIADLDHNRVRGFVQTLRERQLSDQTVKTGVATVKRFCRWCVRRGFLLADPSTDITVGTTHRKHERRFLLRPEWDWMCRHLETAEPWRGGMEAFDRRVCYEVAIFTGLRGAELRRLKRSHLQLTGKDPFVFVKRESTKNKKDAKQYIPRSLAADLLKLVSRKTAGANVFPDLTDKHRRSKMIRRDLEGSRKLWLKSFKDPQERIEKEATDFLAVENEAGEVLNFHSLRYTCGAWLCLAGVDVRTVQRIMRHSTIQLTVDTYGRLLPGAEAEAIAKLTRWHHRG